MWRRDISHVSTKEEVAMDGFGKKVIGPKRKLWLGLTLFFLDLHFGLIGIGPKTKTFGFSIGPLGGIPKDGYYSAKFSRLTSLVFPKSLPDREW